MKITLTENKLRSIIREAIIKHLNESTGNGISISNDEIKQRLRNGEGLSKIFDHVGPMHDEYVMVQKDRKFNFLDEIDCRLLSPQWFDAVERFLPNQKTAPVMNDKKWNLIDKYGYFLLDQSFDWISPKISDGYRLIKNNKKWNYVDEEGKLLSNQWFDGADHFHNGKADVYLYDRSRYPFIIDTNGNIIK